jgi:hypothetical protein
VRRLAAWIAAVASLLAADAARAWSPNFCCVEWFPIGCNDFSEPAGDESPGSIDFVGSATHPGAYVAYDDSYLYFRYRVDADPSGPGGFDQYAWTALMHVASGNPFTHQYQLALNGVGSDDDFGNSGGDNIEIWSSHPSPSRLFAQQYDFSGPATANTSPLARVMVADDGSAFGGDPDYFVEFAFPMSVLIEKAVIDAPADVDTSLFYPQTAASPTLCDCGKDFFDCPFLPSTEVSLTKTVDEDFVCTNATTRVSYTLVARNLGAEDARGLIGEETPFPLFGTEPDVTVSSDDPSVTWTLDIPNRVLRVPRLPAGSSITARITLDVTPGCTDPGFLNLAEVHALNAPIDSASAFVEVGTCAERCDGGDNDCNGQVDDGGDALCSDGDACNGSEVCAGLSGCESGTPPACADTNACTTDGCDPTEGCTHALATGCTPCGVDDDCADGNGCTINRCDEGVCTTTEIDGCLPCTSADDCSDGNVCTGDLCTAGGVCEFQEKSDCIPCSDDGDCKDSNPCTAESCGADGSCKTTFIPGCKLCTSPLDCDDRNSCTEDACTGGVCVNTPEESCCVPTAELCDDGVDNDCDGGTDCDDLSCAAVPACAPKAEICGNCLDDNDNGLTDFEDPACCAELARFPMRLKRGRIVPTTATTSKLRLRSTLDRAGQTDVNPRRQDVFVQLRPAGGTDLFCAHVPAAKFKGKGRKFKFRDRKGQVASAKGLRKVAIKVRRNGTVRFRTAGKRAQLTGAHAGDLQVTIGFRDAAAGDAENRCAMTVQPFRAGRRGRLLAP